VGVGALCEALPINTSLKLLDLSWCEELTDASLTSFGLALTNNYTLYTLKLGCCIKLTDVGLRKLAKALETNTSLNQIDLSWCAKIGLEPAGLSALVTALQKNRTISNIALTGCPCTQPGEKRITALLADLMVLLQSNSRRPRTLASTAVGKRASMIEAPRVRGTRYDVRTAETIQMTLRTAITNGAQLYNADDGEACLKLFTATAEHLYNMLQEEILATAIERCRGVGRGGMLSLQDRAWELRCAFDVLLEDVERDLNEPDVRC